MRGVKIGTITKSLKLELFLGQLNTSNFGASLYSRINVFAREDPLDTKNPDLVLKIFIYIRYEIISGISIALLKSLRDLQ